MIVVASGEITALRAVFAEHTGGAAHAIGPAFLVRASQHEVDPVSYEVGHGAPLLRSESLQFAGLLLGQLDLRPDHVSHDNI